MLRSLIAIALFITIPASFLFLCESQLFTEYDPLIKPEIQSKEELIKITIGEKEPEKEMTRKTDTNKTTKEVSLVTGSIDIGSDLNQYQYKDKVLFVILKDINSNRTVAATKTVVKGFPIEYKISNRNVMSSTPLDQNVEYSIEARLDSDGDPMTKDSENDLFASYDKNIKLGSKSIKMVLTYKK